MSNVLVVYGSTYGQTERIATRIATMLRQGGHRAELHRGDRLPAGLALESYQAAVIAASVLYGHHQRYIIAYVRAHAEWLNRVPSAFVSVCGAAGSNPSEAQSFVDRLLQATGWRPGMIRSFTGAVAYTKYSWLMRWWLKRISRTKGLPTDTSRDWDYTEWEEVDRFALRFAATLEPAAEAPRVPLAGVIAGG
jgi:menaquinone-dependent protoporphyrinogen oxidase